MLSHGKLNLYEEHGGVNLKMLIAADNEKKVIFVSSLGMFLSTLDSGIINVALPSLQQHFKTTITSISWTISLYLLVLSSSIIVFGKCADRYGRVKVFTWGIVLFALSSLLCGLAPSENFLIFSRGLQGLSAAMLQATAVALITTLISKERQGLAIGTLGSVMAAGPILGPTIGGILISTLGWRWIFWINLPICMIGLKFCSSLNDSNHLTKHPINFLPLLFLSLFMFSCIFLTTNLYQFYSKYSIWFYGFVILIISSFFLFIKYEKKSAYPIVSLRSTNKRFFVFLFTTLTFGISTAMILVVPPFLLERIFGFTPWQTGFFIFCAPLGIILTARFSGKYINPERVSPLMVLGFTVMLGALTCLIFSGKNIILLLVFLFFYGIGGGLFQPANIASLMNSIEAANQGAINALNRMVHNFGNALGASLATLFLQVGANNNKLVQWVQFSWGFCLLLIMISLACFYIFKPEKSDHPYATS